MKNIKFILIFLVLTVGLTACTSDNVDPILEIDPMTEFNLLSKMEGNGHSIELYSVNKYFETGYNEIFIRIKDVTSGEYFSNPVISWEPMMHMIHKAHSCPKSDLTVITENNTISKGYLVFQMPGNSDEFWDITFAYKIEGQEFITTKAIDVKAPLNEKQRVATFVGSDETKYILAMVSPKTPEVAVNDIEAVLFEMKNMMSFSPVEGYKVVLDPRMPGMGNHSSPNNKDLIYNTATKSYNGRLSLTMTGYWRINMTLFNTDDELLKGEVVTEEQEASSLYFELEF
ncbi:hypothetical protein KCTC52924_02861 [Arenibacter antarcticus]|uniref:YtkA-like n=1 Tax=Arenibacter antarcticus TaxID=2040469 RepID=A0ABW5VFZ8_9FLAO|nr:hypothetical protein [Arenibacter sp. H213]MCM4167279.1 hypothetical protein [Arenibacter sp. H213]